MEASEKKNPRAHKNPKRKRCPNLTDELKIAIFRDYCTTSQSYSEVARRYKVSKDTVFSLVKKYKENPPPGVHFDPKAVEDRKMLPPLVRVLEAKKDAKAVVEGALALMHHMISADILRAESDGEKYRPLLSARELTAFFDVAAPYALQKIETPSAAKGKIVPEAPEIPNESMRLYDIFKKQQYGKAN